MAKKRRRRRRGSSTSTVMKRARVFGWTAVYGYLDEQTTMLQNVPTVDAIGKHATAAIAAHLLAKHGPRFTRKPMDALSTGLCGVVGLKFGQGGFKSISGYGEDDTILGEIDPAEFADE